MPCGNTGAWLAISLKSHEAEACSSLFGTDLNKGRMHLCLQMNLSFKNKTLRFRSSFGLIPALAL